MITETSTTASALPSICLPPWAGGEPLRRVTPDVACLPTCHQKPSPRAATLHQSRTKCAHAACQDDGLWHGHFHQLFHRQRHAKHGSLRFPVFESDLGHFDPLLDRHGHVEALQDDHRLVNHLRHRNIERRDDRAHSHPFCSTVCRSTRSCGPDTGKNLVWSGAGGRHIVDVKGKVLSACRRGGFARNVAVKCTSLSSSTALAVFCPRKAEW